MVGYALYSNRFSQMARVIVPDISRLTMTDLAATLFEYQYDTPPPDLQAQRPQFRNSRRRPTRTSAAGKTAGSFCGSGLRT